MKDYSNNNCSGEPEVRVILLSRLEGLFLDEEGNFETCRSNYMKLCELGMIIVFISNQNIVAVTSKLEDLEPLSPVLTTAGELFIPEKHALCLYTQEFEGEFSNELEILSSLFKRIGDTGDIVIPIGIGSWPDDAFLALTDLAAITTPGEKPQTPEAVHVCKTAGQDAWNEWADNLRRRVKIILNRDEMRNQQYSQETA